MGDKKDQTTKTTGSMPRESSQVGTHAQTGSNQGGENRGKSDDQSRGQGSQGKGQGMNQGQGQYQGQGQGQGQEGAWKDRPEREMQQGDRTDPAQPSGTSPLDKDQQPVNQNRPGQGQQSPR